MDILPEEILSSVLLHSTRPHHLSCVSVRWCSVIRSASFWRKWMCLHLTDSCPSLLRPVPDQLRSVKSALWRKLQALSRAYHTLAADGLLTLSVRCLVSRFCDLVVLPPSERVERLTVFHLFGPSYAQANLNKLLVCWASLSECTLTLVLDRKLWKVYNTGAAPIRIRDVCSVNQVGIQEVSSLKLALQTHTRGSVLVICPLAQIYSAALFAGGGDHHIVNLKHNEK
jgi:hypothetical protein